MKKGGKYNISNAAWAKIFSSGVGKPCVPPAPPAPAAPVALVVAVAEGAGAAEAALWGGEIQV